MWTLSERGLQPSHHPPVLLCSLTALPVWHFSRLAHSLTMSGRSLPHPRIFWTVFSLVGCISSRYLISWCPPWEQGLPNAKLVWSCSVIISEHPGQVIARFWAFALKDRTERFCDLLLLTSDLRRVLSYLSASLEKAAWHGKNTFTSVLSYTGSISHVWKIIPNS